MNRLQAFKTVLMTLVIFAGIACSAAAADWPTWRGPTATGSAGDANPPITWSETENVKWKVSLPGEGSSSTVISGDRIFFLVAVKTSKGVQADAAATFGRGGRGGRMSQAPTGIYSFDVVCLDRKTGGRIWQKTVQEKLPHEGHHPTGSFASYSPVTDGRYVWASFGSRGVHCLDVDGNHKWSSDLGTLNTRNSFGEGSSPALAGDAIVVVMDHEGDSFVYALNKMTGKTLWKKERDERTSWATPVAVEVNGRLQVITSATNLIRSYDVRTGDIVWQCSGQTSNVIPSPVLGFGMVFCTSGYRGSSLQAIKLGPTGDLTGTDAIVWQVDRGTPYVPSPLLHDGRIYVNSVNRAVVSCYDAATGKHHFVEQRLEGMGDMYASPVGASDRIYFVSRNGTTQVIKSSEELQVLATNKLDDDIDASPAIVGNELFLKGKKYLYCIAKP